MARGAVNDAQQEKAVEFVKDWCKWVIGLSFTSGVGCVAVLQQGVSAGIKIYLVVAIFFFTLTAIVSVMMIAFLPAIVQHLPLVTKTGKQRSVYDFWLLNPIFSIKSLTILQLLLFAAGLLFLFIWVLLKPVK